MSQNATACVAYREVGKGREQDAVSFAYKEVGKGREQDAVSFAYKEVGKGREQDAVSFAYMDVGKGREQDAVSFSENRFAKSGYNLSPNQKNAQRQMWRWFPADSEAPS